MAPPPRELAHPGVRKIDAPGSGWIAGLLGVLIGITMTVYSTAVLELYGWMLFVGLPFAIGVVVTLLRGAGKPISIRDAIGSAITCVTLIGVGLLALALEGAICLVMAAPIWLFAAIIGACIGYIVHVAFREYRLHLRATIMVIAFLPLLTGAEATLRPPPRVHMVSSAIVIDAPVQRVWEHVITFGDIPQPREWLFRTGIAYPVRARILSEGAGALRFCEFSTGSFVEPITIWNEPNHLAFDVIDNPPPMEEFSLFSDVHPPHLDGFLVSQRGEFRLTALDHGRTRITGTTWYEHGLAPEWYWRIHSDFIIHRIHGRVLEHIKVLAERGQVDLP